MSTYVSLYRKYRPQTFADVVGQGHITRILQNALESGRVAHAYLFCGPRGTGKTTTARLLAKALNCANGPARDPCNACPSCERVTAGSALDVIEIDAASNRGIDDIRELRDKVKYAPAEGRYKVYVIDECHMLTTEAFNALLKTLEEPPPHVLFILATTDPQKVPATILSRCQRLDFRRGSVADLMQRLRVVAAGERVDADEEALLLIARSADGSWRDALSILEQIVAFGTQRLTADDVRTILGTINTDLVMECTEALACGDAARALQVVARLADEGKDPRDFLRALAAHWRNLLLVGASGGAVLPDGVTTEEARALVEQSRRVPPPLCLRVIEALSDAEREMRRDSQRRLLLEIALLRVIAGPRPGTAPAVQQAGQPALAAGHEPAYAAPSRETPPAPSLSFTPEPPPAAPPAQRTEPAPEAGAPTSSGADAGGALQFEDVLARWPLIVERVGTARLRGILREARPARVRGREILLLVRQGYTFHRDQLEKPENLRAVTESAQQALGGKVTIRVAMEDEEGGGHGASDDALPPQPGPLAVVEPAPPLPPRAQEQDPYDADTMSVKDVLDLFHGRVVQHKDEG